MLDQVEVDAINDSADTAAALDKLEGKVPTVEGLLKFLTTKVQSDNTCSALYYHGLIGDIKEAVKSMGYNS